MRYTINISEQRAKALLGRTFVDANKTLAKDIIITGENLAFDKVEFCSLELSNAELLLLIENKVVCIPDKNLTARLLDNNYTRAITDYRKMELSNISGRGVKIGAIDTGCNAVTGYALDASVNYADANPGVADNYHHGTNGASIVKGFNTYTDGSGTYVHSGFANGSTLHIIKAVQDDGTLTNSSFIAAVNYAIAQGLDCIYLPFSIVYAGSQALIDALLAANCIPFCAAGNATGTDYIVEPATLNGAVAVGSIREDGTLGYFNTTPVIPRTQGLDFVVGGYGQRCIDYAGTMSSCYGTSFSAPSAAAIFACWKEKTGLADNKQVLQIMKNNNARSAAAFGLGILKC